MSTEQVSVRNQSRNRQRKFYRWFIAEARRIIRALDKELTSVKSRNHTLEAWRKNDCETIKLMQAELKELRHLKAVQCWTEKDSVSTTGIPVAYTVGQALQYTIEKPLVWDGFNKRWIPRYGV